MKKFHLSTFTKVICTALILLGTTELWAAAPTQVIINNKDLLKGETVVGASYSNGVLTLDNFTLTDPYIGYIGEIWSDMGIYINGDVVIELKNTNTLTIPKSTGGKKETAMSCGIYTPESAVLEIRKASGQEGTLVISTGDNTISSGAIMSMSDITIHDGTYILTSGKAMMSYAIMTGNEATITINGGDITATSAEATAMSVALATTNGDLTINGGTIKATAGAAQSGSYGIYSGKDIIINDGTGISTTLSSTSNKGAFNKSPKGTLGATITNWADASCQYFATGIDKTEAVSFSTYIGSGKEMLHIVSEEAIAKIEILDLSGRLQAQTNNSNSIAIGNLGQGSYLVRIYNTNNRIASDKFIK